MAPLDIRHNTDTLHKLASIGFVKSFGKNREWFSYRRDMTGESLKFLVNNFVGIVKEARQEMTKKLPKSISDGYKKYAELRKGSKNLSPEQSKLVHEKFKILENMLSLPIYSWNGERYDLPVLLGPLIDVLSENAPAFKRMNVIKRGTSLMELKYNFLFFRDFINFSNPMSLGKWFLYLILHVNQF